MDNRYEDACGLCGLIAGNAGMYQEGGVCAPPPPDVTVTQPLVKTVTNYLDETGTTEAVKRVEVDARVRGYLTEQLFEAGTDIKEGDLLYKIDPREYQAKVDAAAAELKSAQVSLEKAEIELQRQKKLRVSNATSETDLVAAQAERDGSIAAVAESQAQLDQTKLDLEYTEIRSPIDGRVGKTLVKPGNLVGDSGATQLTTVISYDPIYANFNVSERDLLEIRGQRSESERSKDRTDTKLYLRRANDDGFPYEGTFDYADLAVDQSTGTFMVRGIFPNAKLDILPGLFVTVRIPLGKTEDAMLIPERAVGSDQAGRYVWVVGGDNTAVRADVQVGDKYEDLIVITAGLKADDWVIVDGTQRVRANSKVTPEKTTLPDSGGEITTVRQDATLPATEGDEEEPSQDESSATPKLGIEAAENAASNEK